MKKDPTANFALSLQHNSAVCETFSSAYPHINELLMKHGDEQSSRYGDTKEFLDFKTTITNPTNRCVGGHKRNINVFFLLAEAMWIWAGRKDVEFLSVFNKKMTEFSDDAIVFHAPYGWRLRNWGKTSDNKGLGSRDQYPSGDDQIERCLLLLSEDNTTRRAVASIWNPDMDLDVTSVDIPCNDLLMFKIRKGRLFMTVANRSNDLHWGLPTNVFQFSYILEVMANVLGVEVGSQTHNSQSLHTYTENPIGVQLLGNFKTGFGDIYDMAKSTPMDFNFGDNKWWKGRLVDVDLFLNQIVDNLHLLATGGSVDGNFETHLKSFSDYHFFVYKLLSLYIDYTKTNKNDRARIDCIKAIISLHNSVGICDDYALLAINYMAQRIKTKETLFDVLPEVMSSSKLNKQSFPFVGAL